MRILFTQAHPRDVTLGSPKSVLRLGEALVRRGHRVDYLFLDDLPPQLRERRSLYLTFPAVIAARAVRGAYDLVDVSSGDAFLVAALRRLLRKGQVPIVSRVLGVEHLHWQGLTDSARAGEEHLTWYHRLWFGGLRLREVEWSLRLASHVLCLCRQDTAFILARGWQDPSRVSVVPPGVDDVYLAAEPADLTAPNVLFLGTWTARKGVRDLVQAFDRVLERVPMARLVVAGAHAPTERVLNSFNERTRSAVRVVPTGGEQELLGWMRSCSVMTLPSLYEGFGIAFLEAMAVGLPVVGTPTGGMADLIEPGQNGDLVPARDPAALARALLAIVRSPERRCALGHAARQTAQQYTWQRAAQETEAVYGRLAG